MFVTYLRLHPDVTELSDCVMFLILMAAVVIWVSGDQVVQVQGAFNPVHSSFHVGFLKG